MDIVTRLKMFLDKSGIANSQFADTCGIPRPTLSQLLNGRNKKVSDEVFAKIHRAYPQLNIMWLMFGDGTMMVDEDSSSMQSSPMAQSRQHGLFADDFTAPSHEARPHPTQQTTISFGADNTQQPRQSQPSAALADALQNIAVGSRAQHQQHSSQSGAKQIKHILVLYSDGSVETYTPGLQQMAM